MCSQGSCVHFGEKYLFKCKLLQFVIIMHTTLLYKFATGGDWPIDQILYKSILFWIKSFSTWVTRINLIWQWNIKNLNVKLEPHWKNALNKKVFIIFWGHYSGLSKIEILLKLLKLYSGFWVTNHHVPYVSPTPFGELNH